MLKKLLLNIFNEAPYPGQREVRKRDDIIDNLYKMKQIATAIFICLANVTLLQAQTASRFPIDPQARWRISELMLYFNLNGSYQQVREKYEYFIDSDTTINSRQYYKLYKTGVAWYDLPFYYERIYAGAIRDEDNKFYLVRKDSDAEVLLIDYDLELGDTIRGEIGYGNIINQVEDLVGGRKAISSVPEICGGCCSTITLLEGMGHSGGIMEEPPCFHIGFYGHYLNCFEIGGELIYRNEMEVVDCDNFLSSGDVQENISNVIIYPVPAGDILTVEFPGMGDDCQVVDIFNITGSLVLARQIKSNKTEIDIQHLAKGMYFVRVSDQVSCVIRKVVIE